MKDLQNIPYKSRFVSQAKVIVPKEEDRYLALASLDNLKRVIPSSANVEENPDLLYIASNLFVAGMVNKNGDAITIEDAKKLSPLFLHKFIDLDHKRTKIAGAITNSAYTTYGGNEIIEDISDYNEPFNMAYGGILWKILNPKLAEILINASDENSDIYNSISSSWEIGFWDYNIAVGSKFVAEADIVTEEKKKRELVEKYLKDSNIGITKQGEFVYRVIKWPQIAIGAGLVRNPAADVKGVAVLFEENPLAEEEEDQEDSESKEIAAKEKVKEVVSNEKNSKKQKISVSSQHRGKTMTFEKLYKLIEENADQETFASAKAFIEEVRDGLSKANDEYLKKVNQEREAKEKVEGSLASLQEEVEKLKKAEKQLAEKLAKAEEVEQKRALEERFNNRMAGLDEEYELEDSDRQAVAKYVRDLNDEEYSQWKTGTFDVLAGYKNKEMKKKEEEKKMKEKEEMDKEDKEKESKASEEEKEKAAKEALASAKEDESPSNPGHVETAKTIKEKFKGAFGEDSYEFSKR